MTTSPDTPKPLRRVTIGGVLAMATGFSLTAIELGTGFAQERLGPYGRATILICGTLFSVWGLKELIAGWWPRLGRNGLIRNRFHIPLEGWAFLGIMFVLFIGSLMGKSNPLMLVFSMMAGAFVVNGWLTFTYLKGVTVERLLPDRVMAGEPFSVEIGLRNRKSWLSAWLMTVQDHVSGMQTELAPEVVFIRLSPGEQQRGHYQLVLVQRGVYEFGPVYVDTRFPLGLVERGLNLSVAARLRVYPQIGRLQPDWKRKVQTATEQTSSQVAQGGIFEDEFHSLREYRMGDDLRSVHWRTSARRNELMVREYRDSRDRNLLILLDAWMPADSRDSDLEDYEHALSFVATVCIDATRNSRDSRTTLSVQGTSLTVWRGGGGGEKIEALLDTLSELQPDRQRAIAPLFEATVGDRSNQPRILLLTRRPEEAQSEIRRLSAQDHALVSVQILKIGSPELRQICDLT